MLKRFLLLSAIIVLTSAQERIAMNDETVTIAQLKEQAQKFVSDRKWDEFQDPKNLSMAISKEASELLEHFIWCNNAESWQELEKKREQVEDEVADVASALLKFCFRARIDLAQAMARKNLKNEKKYPVSATQERQAKHDEYYKMKEKSKNNAKD